MTCSACDDARQAMHGFYVMGCAGCTARAIAYSQTAWQALHKSGNGDRQALTDMVSRLMPSVDHAEARRMVVEWWKQRKHA